MSSHFSLITSLRMSSFALLKPQRKVDKSNKIKFLQNFSSELPICRYRATACNLFIITFFVAGSFFLENLFSENTNHNVILLFHDILVYYSTIFTSISLYLFMFIFYYLIINNMWECTHNYKNISFRLSIAHVTKILWVNYIKKVNFHHNGLLYICKIPNKIFNFIFLSTIKKINSLLLRWILGKFVFDILNFYWPFDLNFIFLMVQACELIYYWLG